MKKWKLIVPVFALAILAMIPALTSCSNKNRPSLAKMLEDPASFPFSFKYDGKASKGFGDGFEKVSYETSDAADGKNIKASFLHKKSGVLFTVEGKEYSAYDACEWTIWLENTGTAVTDNFSDLMALDWEAKGRNQILKGMNGDLGDMYAPYAYKMAGNTVIKGTDSGRPTHGDFPYFNLEYGNGGTFIAVGWPGSWKATFKGGSDTTRVTAGQNRVDMYLDPGDRIRTPLIVMVNYSGRDENKNMNLWRHWFMDCNMYHPDGERFEPVFCASSGASGMTTAQFKKLINTYTANGLHLDYLWIDAGWYTNAKGESCSWPETGTLEVDTRRFPDRFAEVSELMHGNGGKVMLWFEAEVMRCNKEDFIENMPGFKKEWFLGTAAAGSWLEGQLFDLGNPECLEWLLNRIYKVIDDGNIDMFRSDFNVNPGPVWSGADDLFKDGYRENLYVQGYLKMWDSLLERYPSMMIDSCASGGGRNDIETMRRSVPLHISDFWDGNDDGFNERQTCMLEFSRWIPYFKLEVHSTAPATIYNYRSSMAPWFILSVNYNDDNSNWALAKQAETEWRELSRYYYSDFYPLTEFSKSPDAWRAWEYYDPATKSGAIQIFRGPESETSEMTLRLCGLGSGKYTLRNADGTFEAVVSASKLKNGYTFRLPEPESCDIIFFEKN
ncbi:MAG: alpha-galactosidase [Clostridia bacterium]|nr:alpha-galactosidase [Clostridia bacterium]